MSLSNSADGKELSRHKVLNKASAFIPRSLDLTIETILAAS
jgi:hypothetical protein